MRPTLLLLALIVASGLSARETLVIPHGELEVKLGGEAKLTVDGKVTVLTQEQARKLSAEFNAVRAHTLKSDLAAVQDLEAAVVRAGRTTTSAQREVERLQTAIDDQQRRIPTLEARLKALEDELKEATERGYNVNFENLRAKINTLGSSLASDRKDLETARAGLGNANKRKAEAAAREAGLAAEAAAARKALTERVERLRAALAAAATTAEKTQQPQPQSGKQEGASGKAEGA